MNLPNPYRQYQTTQVATASHEKMIVMLHDSAIRHLQQAIPHLQAHDYYNQNLALNKALAVIAHMRGSLRVELESDLPKQLAWLYDYLFRRVTHANVHDEIEPVEEAIRILREHRAAWAEVARQAGEGTQSGGAHSGVNGTGPATSRDLSLAV